MLYFGLLLTFGALFKGDTTFRVIGVVLLVLFGVLMLHRF